MMFLLPTLLSVSKATDPSVPDTTGHAVHQATHQIAETTSILTPVVEIALPTGIIVLCLASLLCLWRLLRGPHLSDRVLASDTFSLMVVGLVIILTIELDSAIFMDAAMLISILGFAGTVAMAQFINARRHDAMPNESQDSQPAQTPDQKEQP